MERNFVKSFRSQVNDIQDLRAVIDHSQSETGGFFAREHLRHYDSIVQAVLNKCRDKDKVKLRPEDEKLFWIGTAGNKISIWAYWGIPIRLKWCRSKDSQMQVCPLI